jgi:serine/threonine-protein kinase RsbW
MEWRFPNRLDDLSRVGTEAGRFLEAAGVGGRAAYAVHLAIEELGSNILKYGYDDAAVHEILLGIEVQSRVLSVVLEDDGHPFNPLEAPQPDVHLPAENRLPGGLGIHLVRQTADRVAYQRCAGRNRVTVEIKVSADDRGASPEIQAKGLP